MASKILNTTETDLVEGYFYMWMIKYHPNFFPVSSNIESVAVEFHQNKRKWLSLCVYKPPNQNDSVLVEAISVIINEYPGQYEHIVIFGDFNVSIENSHCNLIAVINCNLINKIQEMSLRLIMNDKTSTFEHLLQANNEITQENLQVLMVEVFNPSRPVHLRNLY